MLNAPFPTVGMLAVALAALFSSATAQERNEEPTSPPPLIGRTPTELPKIPPPDPNAALFPPGFAVQVVTANLIYPTSIEFDDQGAMYIAEAGFTYGDEAAPARVSRVVPAGERFRVDIVADQLSGPVNDILWHRGRLYISHRGKISVLEGPMKVVDLVTDLPSLGDHHNNGLAAGPDGKIYFGQGVATNSGVVGMDNFQFGWLKQYPDVHDIPARDIVMRAKAFESIDPITLLNQNRITKVGTFAFQPFGKANGAARAQTRPDDASDVGVVKGRVKANGTILRMNRDGSELEVYAWGLRNPFGLGFTPDGRLLCTDAGYDERGARPIANAPDCLWEIKQGAWYGFPDFVAGEPVTDPKFRSKRGPAPDFLLAEHPEPEKPILALPPHTGGAKFDLSRGGAFGEGQAYVALLGDMYPSTGEPTKHPGFGVARLDMTTLQVEPFFKTRPEALGPKGFEYVATAGPKRPVDVKFSPDGRSLYVVDFGAMTAVPTAVGASPRPFPGTGVIWRISAVNAPPP
jgi:glucose/arabinose dehydrogenase